MACDDSVISTETERALPCLIPRMDTTDDDAKSRTNLLGRWLGTSENETLDYTFEPNNRFTVVSTVRGEPPSKIWGFWDVGGGSLRLGTSASECEELAISLRGDEFSITDPTVATRVFRRQV
jgi:hypothetical protein